MKSCTYNSLILFTEACNKYSNKLTSLIYPNYCAHKVLVNNYIAWSDKSGSN